MIYKETILKNADNSGINWSKCIQVKGTCNKKIGRLGDMILICVFRMSVKKKIKKKKYWAVISAVSGFTKRLDGSFVRFFKNKILLLSEQFKFLGTRVYGPIPKEIRLGQKEVLYKKIISYTWTI